MYHASANQYPINRVRTAALIMVVLVAILGAYSFQVVTTINLRYEAEKNKSLIATLKEEGEALSIKLDSEKKSARIKMRAEETGMVTVKNITYVTVPRDIVLR